MSETCDSSSTFAKIRNNFSGENTLSRSKKNISKTAKLASQNQNLMLSTPTKRKLLCEEKVQNFDGTKTTTLNLSLGLEESPAKCRLLCRNSGGQ